ncbi:MAG: CoA transferase [Chloroflexi bacterium]|nr:CoA transferase [Chloroflexota bacterium]
MTGPGLPPGFLNGVRIIDFSWYAVGPWGPRMLAPYGAEIIHIEPPHQPDDHRFDFRAARGINAKDQKVWHEEGSPPFYTGPYWNQLHNGKLGISLNTRHPEGMRLLHELIKKSDALVENFSGNVLDSWDLTWENLLKLNPKLTYLSTAGFGHKGPWGGFRTFGPSAQAGSGLTYTSGLPGREPAGWGYSHMDIAGGWIGGLGLIMGLLQARRTGKGVRVDYAVTEAAMSLLGPYFLDYQVNGRGTDRPDFPPGNHSEWPGVAPHNTYRCAGIDRQGQDWWVFIAAETQEQFEALCDVMKKPELLTDARFATNEARVKNQDVLDEIISTWTAPRRRYEVQAALQSVGVIAVAVQGAEDRVDYDPQLRHREIYPVIQHPEIGEFEIEAFPPKMSRTPPNNTLRSPLIREHTDYVFGDLLGMSEGEISDYRAQGII